jgi:UDP-N-acetylmuramate--alanine ligase
VEDEKIKAAVAAFKGVKRRFEYVIAPQEETLVFIDDYAHHPEELKALIAGARSLFGNRQLIVLFQPHLFTRTRDLADEFAASLDLADEVWLLPIYPARELPIEGVTSEMILQRMKLKNKRIVTKEEIMEEVKHINKKAVFVTAGAGDIDALLPQLKQQFEAANG